NREVLTETRSRVMEREAEAGALRAALATNQKQAQARECDNEELQAALSIASETLEARRAELRQARAELETTTARFQKNELHATGLENELRAQNERTGQQTSELSQLKATVPCLQKELEHSRSEFEVLRERLAERESELVDLRETLTRTGLECETLGDELSTERQALALARERASQREATLASLRETLASIGKAASVAPLCGEPTAIEIEPTPQPAEPVAAESEADPQQAAQETQDEEAREVEQVVAESLPSLEDLPEPWIADGPEVTFTPANAEADPGSGEAALLELIPRRAPFEAPGIFRMWRDGQIAKKLAPIGIASADEFFAGRIEPLFSTAPSGGLEILSLGGEDREFELRVARGLRKLGRDGFRIHFPVADPEHGDEIVRMGSQAGLDSELVPFRADAGASDLETLLFQAIIGDGALSRSDHLEPLVLALAEATRHGAMLAIAERTGRGGSRAAQEMGERIWRLMPERYKHNQLADRVETEYWRGEPGEGDEADLLALLRTHFAFEDFATFGHLVDRFVGPEIGPNFDPADDRDRRFIEQIANLDEAKLDAGALSPLHMVARLTARDPFVR
ncbi:MAG: hypothetical protein GY733_22225, partial [bacterium]|nr:hypothetical protein [bacterium]